MGTDANRAAGDWARHSRDRHLPLPSPCIPRGGALADIPFVDARLERCAALIVP